MTAPQQRDLFTKRYRKVHGLVREVPDLHIPLVAALRLIVRPNVIWRHVPNGEHRDKRTAAKLKAMGVLPGSADLEFHWVEIDEDDIVRRRLLHLELKVGNRKPSDAQIAFRLAMELLGDEYHVARSVGDAIDILREYGLLREGVRITGNSSEYR